MSIFVGSGQGEGKWLGGRKVASITLVAEKDSGESSTPTVLRFTRIISVKEGNSDFEESLRKLYFRQESYP